MMNESYDDRNILTNLAVRVGQLEGVIKTFMERWKDQDDAASLGRRVTHEKIELISMQVERLSNDLQHLQQDFAEFRNEVDDEIMPVVRTSEYAAQRKAGARGVLISLYGGLVVLISALAYIADRAVAWLTHKP